MEHSFSKEDTYCLKNTAIILMIIHHMFLFHNRLEEGIIYQAYLKWNNIYIIHIIAGSGKLCVAIFLFLSGYGTYLQYKQFGGVWQFYFNKIKKVYIMYWISLLVFVPIRLLINHETTTFYEVVNNLCGIEFTFNGEIWFIRPFVICMVLFPILVKMIDNKYDNILIDFFIVITIDVLAKDVLLNIRGLQFFSLYAESRYANWSKEVLLYFSSFLMGSMFAKHDLLSKCKRYMLEKNKYYRIFLGSICVWFSLYYQFFCGENYMYLISLGFIYGIIMIFAQNSILKRIFVYCGKRSTFMWLVHSYFCYYCFQKYIYALKIDILVFLICYLSSLLASIFLEKLLNLLEKWIVKN